MDRAQKNFVLGIVHEGLWGAGSSLVQPATILSLALFDLGQSAGMAGLLASLFLGGICLPQFFSALFIPPRFTDPKRLAWVHAPAVMGPLVAGLGFALSTPQWQSGRLVLVFVGTTLFGLGMGIVSPHWVASMGRCIPEDRRGRYFGSSFFASGLCGTFMGWIGARLASRAGMSGGGYTICFAAAVPLLAGSAFVFSRLKPILAEPDAPPKRVFRGSIDLLKVKLMRPSAFRTGVVLVILMTFAMAPGNLFTVYLREEAHVDASWFQIFTPAFTVGGMIGAFLLGWTVDHKGLRTAYALAFTFGLAALGLICLWGSKLFPALAYVSWGFASSTFVVVNLVLVLKLGGREESTIHAGLFSTLMGPWTLAAPLAAGWLATSAGYTWTFGLAAACCPIAFWLLVNSSQLDDVHSK